MKAELRERMLTPVIHFNYNLNTALAGTKRNLYLSLETEEEKGARLENVADTKRLRLAMETYEEMKIKNGEDGSYRKLSC